MSRRPGRVNSAQVPHAKLGRESRGFIDHFRKRDRFAGMVAAFLTSGGIVGFLTYVGAWLKTTYDMGIERIGLLFMVSGVAAIVAAPLSGWNRLPVAQQWLDRHGVEPVARQRFEAFLTQSPTAAKVSDADKESLFRQFQAWDAEKTRAQAGPEKK